MTHLSENTEIRTKMTDRPLPEKLVKDKQTNFFVGPYGEQDCHNVEYDID